jgi:hypothetical protein
MKIQLSNVLLAAFLATPTLAQQALGGAGGAAGDRFGTAVIVAGDQNGDGYNDLLVGAPGFNGSRGAVRCISGKYLANQSSTSILWSITTPPVNAGAEFGTSLAAVGNVTGDSTPDFVVGAPNFLLSGVDTRGAIFLVDGGTRAIVAHIYGLPQTRLGMAMVSVGDQTGDFRADLAVSARHVSTSSASLVHIIPTSAFGANSALANISHASHSNGWHQYGAALASGFDYNGDGRLDLAIGVPNFGASGSETGYVEIRDATSLSLLRFYTPGVPGERFGASISAGQDFDGDGVIDLVVGSPGWSGGFVEDGRVRVLSGAKLVNPSLPGPNELFTLTLGFSSTTFDLNLGAAVHACRDLNNDGVGDILAGAPGYSVFSGGVKNRGAVAVFSGATGTRMGVLFGFDGQRLGDAIVGDFDDLDGDGFEDFVVAGPLADGTGLDHGVIRAYRIFPATPTAFCTAKTNSLGCAPSMSSSGAPSVSSSTPFLVNCSSVLNQVSGLLFYSQGPGAAPFQGGTLCVRLPTRRTPPQNSGGSSSGADCSGVLSIDFNARIQSGVDPTLVAGAEVFGQYWSRDPASPSTTSLSNGLRFLIRP